MGMAKAKTGQVELQEAVDQVLGQIIDEWYERISPHYLTDRDSGNEALEPELKFFHDDKGHRIKFNKEEVDFSFTYGLRSYCEEDHCVIEISVNNKAEKFDYNDFQNRLVSHYDEVGQQELPTPYELRNHPYHRVFKVDPDWSVAFRVEKHETRASIMRLLFRVEERFARELVAHPIATKKLIEDYCVSPFRRLYAAVYRRHTR